MKKKLNLILLFITTIIIFGKFKNIISTQEIPGLDTPGHFFALNKMVFEYLPNFKISGYALEWFGGFPLFLFYAPLWFILVGGSWVLFFQNLPLVLIYRISILLLIISFSFCFYIFTKAFLGKKAAKWSIPISLLYIFYPKYLSFLGFGAGGAIWGGLQSNLLGINLTMLYLASLKKTLNEATIIKIILTSFLLSAIVLAHTMSAIIAFITTAVLLAHHKSIKNILTITIITIQTILLSGFWLIPFLQNLFLSSGEIGIVNNTFHDPLHVIFPFNPIHLLNIKYLLFIKYWALLLIIGVGWGIYKLIKNKKSYMPALFIFFYFVLLSNWLPNILPQIPIHYQRFAPFTFIIALAILSFSMSDFWQKINTSNSKTTIQYITLIIFTLIITQTIIQFDIGTSPFSNNFKKLYSAKLPISWQWSDYKYHSQADIILDKLKTQNIQRAFFQTEPVTALTFLGSTHYFTSQMPLKNNQAVIPGLYAESSSQTPFIMPSLNAFSRGKTQTWGQKYLSKSSQLYLQPLSTHIKRLELLGLSHVIVHQPSLKTKLSQEKQIKLIDKTNDFSIFELKNPKPLAYIPNYQPILFIPTNKNTKLYKTLSQILFIKQETFEIPIAFSNLSEDQLNKYSHNFSLLIIDGTKLTKEKLNYFKNLEKKLIIINPNNKIARQITMAFENNKSSSQISLINITPIDKIKSFYKIQPEWLEFQSLIFKSIRNHKQKHTSKIIANITNSKIKISNSTNQTAFTHLNIGYSPYWQIKDCPSCIALQSTPASQILILSDQKQAVINLSYDDDKTAIISKKASLISLAVSLIILTKLIIKKYK